MVIHFGNTELEVKAEDNSYRLRAVKGVDKLVLYYSLTHHVEIPLGAWWLRRTLLVIFRIP